MSHSVCENAFSASMLAVVQLNQHCSQSIQVSNFSKGTSVPLLPHSIHP